MPYLIGIDIGTSATKTVMFDPSGTIVSQATVNYPIITAKAGWAEQDPLCWWIAVKETLKIVTAKARDHNETIAGIGLTGQMHGLVMLDQNNSVLRNSIIWCDQRAERECEELSRIIGSSRLCEITGNVPVTGFTLPKILWVRNNEPIIYQKCRHILLPKDYIRFKLTGNFTTDVSDASGTQLLDINTRTWSNELLEKLNIDPSLLCEVLESEEISGYISKEVATVTGLQEHTIVVAGAGDQAAAAIGNGIISQGLISCNLGSSGVVFAATDQPLVEPSGKVQTFCHAIRQKWHIMGVTQGAGISIEWFRANLMQDGNADFASLNHDIENSAIGCGGVFLPYLYGERSPHLDSHARGVFFGLDNTTTVKKLARAVMEGVSFSLKECLDVIQSLGISADKIILSGGGANSKVWREMIADCFDMEVRIPGSTDAGPLGVALLAGVAADIYLNLEDAVNTTQDSAMVIEPNEKNTVQYRKYFSIYQELYQRLKSLYKKL